uniref:Mitochondrial pyruvate carrier n=1 Tax=Grammatophora oceanica TaxID=210454 RepID=A0A7S1UWQ4_9STRA|mmetsp:Transcript_27412/g.40217  ORF Transcript_27412/g.40217 Transcript_27412/m.40217 type:complete len:147 (+) Transcript_27412:82-522(+)|eukprot:CAMPEP_0194027110 /NCGR_PEP_ID=MMETSP0009_2-20130614/1332_1 /TAXON_ID=210454 /ORGANISM="Grammatophora oceanica, Strain CCMP 410" /LENGTH=146 /DNA_ID=CAMNT_0038666065 /DNA_START=61 /DNA_END=501 /DNA_ORIENTATION=+
MSLNAVLTALMPISQATSWFLVTKASDTPKDLYANVSKLALFYAGWAGLNIYRGRSDVGIASMGCLSLASYCQHKNLTAASTALVIANFGLGAQYVLLQWDAKTLADKLGRSINWAYIFKGYFYSSILFWSTVMYKVVKSESPKQA